MIPGVVAGFPAAPVISGVVYLDAANSYWTAGSGNNRPLANRTGNTVTLNGLFTRNASGSGTATQVTVLPVGYRPAAALTFTGAYNDSPITLTIRTDGSISVPSSVSGTEELSIYMASPTSFQVA